jgi:hypothetical protein
MERKIMEFYNRNGFTAKLLGSASVFALAATFIAPVHAADLSTTIEAGGAITAPTGATADTWIIDATNDGATNAAVTYGTGNGSLTISSDGTATSDTGTLASVTTADNSGTNQLVLNDSTNGDSLTLLITGNVTGDVTATANDLDVTVNALSTDDAGDTTLSLQGNVVVGTGTITLTGDVDDTPTLLFSGTTAQTSDAAIVVTTDGFGILSVTNTAGVTISDIVGVAAKGLESISIASGATLTQKLGITTAGTFDVVGNVDDGSGGQGGSLTIGAGNAVTTTAGGAVTLATITGNTNVTTLSVVGGNAGTTAAGGAVTKSDFVGTTTATTYNLTGGDGGAIQCFTN